MSTEIGQNGVVHPPLNITAAPAPKLELKGFAWDTVDNKIHGSAVPGETKTKLGWGGKVNDKLDFPLQHFEGSWAGNGFNLIFRPRANNLVNELPNKPGKNASPNDNILELNLTLEQMLFTTPLGNVPNRGLRSQPDIILTGVPYIQTVQDVTNPETGKGDHPLQTGIHFEPGVWLNVPPATQHNGRPTIARMASIPHGTTINAQGFAPTKSSTDMGGVVGGPVIEDINSIPFEVGKNPDDVDGRLDARFVSMLEQNNNDFRLPQNLDKFGKNGSKRITSEIIKNPNLVLRNANRGLDIQETIMFSVSTGPPTPALNGGGVANISFLLGEQTEDDLVPENKVQAPVAHAVSMTATYWIEKVLYTVIVPPNLPGEVTLELRPLMPDDSTAPTPAFKIATPKEGTGNERVEIKVPGIQIQSSQTVLLNFNEISWPHVSVSTLVPKDPQYYDMQQV